MITLSKDPEKCKELLEIQKIIREIPFLDEKFGLDKGSILKPYKGILAKLRLELIAETNKEIIIKQ